MARITVEDCLEKVNNRFELVVKAAKSARQLSIGSRESRVPWENDKPTVVALREIAAGYFGGEEEAVELTAANAFEIPKGSEPKLNEAKETNETKEN